MDNHESETNVNKANPLVSRSGRNVAMFKKVLFVMDVLCAVLEALMVEVMLW